MYQKSLVPEDTELVTIPFGSLTREQQIAVIRERTQVEATFAARWGRPQLHGHQRPAAWSVLRQSLEAFDANPQSKNIPALFKLAKRAQMLVQAGRFGDALRGEEQADWKWVMIWFSRSKEVMDYLRGK